MNALRAAFLDALRQAPPEIILRRLPNCTTCAYQMGDYCGRWHSDCQQHGWKCDAWVARAGRRARHPAAGKGTV